jgi:hypothetical protein
MTHHNKKRRKRRSIENIKIKKTNKETLIKQWTHQKYNHQSTKTLSHQ